MRQGVRPWHERLGEIGPCVYVCVGSDRSSGDSLGPLVGTLLREAEMPHVWGTLQDPLHAGSLPLMLRPIRDEARRLGLPVLAIDACLGNYESVGKIVLHDGPLRPGAGLHKDLPPIGDFAVFATVNVGGFLEYVVPQNTRMSVVYGMAKEIAGAIVGTHGAARQVAASKEAAR